jgi:hypothetical protein
MFMHATFEGMFEADFFRSSQGEMKHTFLQLLIATSHDFVMRAVPRQSAAGEARLVRAPSMTGAPSITRPPSMTGAPSTGHASSKRSRSPSKGGADEVKHDDEAGWVLVEAAAAAGTSFNAGDEDDLPPMQRCVIK